MLITLLKGIIIGTIVSAPLGPVGILCLRETLYGGRREGMLTGLGAMLSDVIYGFVVYLGVGMVLDFVVHYDATLRIVGGAIICAFSYYIFRQATRGVRTEPTKRLSKIHGARKVLTAFLVTLSNPFIMLLILPLYTRFQFVQPSSYPAAEISVAMVGIGLGCMLWWTFLTYWVRWMAKRMGDTGIRRISYTVASALCLLGIIGMITGVQSVVTGTKSSARLIEISEGDHPHIHVEK